MAKLAPFPETISPCCIKVPVHLIPCPLDSRNDVAIQTHVITHALQQMSSADLFNPGLSLQHFYLLYNGGDDGFQRDDQLATALNRQEEIAAKVAHFKTVLQAPEPSIEQSDHCMQPYECPYREYCQQKAIMIGFIPSKLKSSPMPGQ